MTPTDLGIGLRISVHPHCDTFVDAILGGLADVAAAGLTDGLDVRTGVVSTEVKAVAEPAEQLLAAYVVGLTRAVWERSGGAHVVTQVLLSRGCPGETSCDLRLTSLPTTAPVDLPSAGLAARADWSLYPLLDGSDLTEHLDPVYAAIEQARAAGMVSGKQSYATALAGDLADIVSLVTSTWTAVGRTVPHVVTHLTLSVGSPSVEKE